MATITVTGVDPSLKQRLKLACLRTNSDMSTAIRDHLQDIVERRERIADQYERDLEAIRRDALQGGDE